MLLKQLTAAAIVATTVCQVPAQAQFYNSGCSSCAASAPPVAVAQANCTPVMPVQQTCYQTVPITTYKRERQTVQEPYYKTSFEDRTVTVMEPVTRRRTVEVPTVSYQTVTENRTVQRDLGRWQTNYQRIAKCAPCQVDPRPGMIGWLNRTGYAFRNSFVPNYRTSRQYVPRLVTCNVPTTRQVAVRGTKRVVVNETQMVARQKTERVEVRKLAFREKEVTVMRPQVAYQTVPIGTTTAFGYGGGTSLAYGYGRSSFAYSPYGFGTTVAIEDDDDDSRTAIRPESDSNFTPPVRTTRPFEGDDLEDRRASRRASADDGTFHRPSSFEKTLEPATFNDRPAPTDPTSGYPAFDDSQTRRSNIRDSQVQPANYRPSSDRRTSSRKSWQASTRGSSDMRTARTSERDRRALTMKD